jgi:hypothetical protein
MLVALVLAVGAAGCARTHATRATAAEWTPAAWAEVDTLELATVAPGEAPYWFRVWLVVLDGQAYVRLGTRAAGRIEASTTKPYLGVRVAGKEFARVEGVPAPDMVARVADAMRAKYRTDVLVRWMAHPLTLRLVPG